jgi:hypothetical protein
MYLYEEYIERGQACLRFFLNGGEPRRKHSSNLNT